MRVDSVKILPASRHLEPCLIMGTSSLHQLGPFPVKFNFLGPSHYTLMFYQAKMYLSIAHLSSEAIHKIEVCKLRSWMGPNAIKYGSLWLLGLSMSL